MIFLQNKYTNWYYAIITRSKSQDRKKKTGIYYESHHIIPSCLGGSDSKENKVLLTAREHFICHWLLTKMVNKNIKYKLLYALSRMSHSSKFNSGRKLTAKQYEVCKIAVSLATKLRPKLSREAEEKRIQSIKLSWDNDVERKQKLSERFKGKSNPKSQITRYRIAKSLKGIPHPIWRKEQKSKYQRKTWKITNSEGLMFVTDNRKQWAIENGYNDTQLTNLFKGRIKSHKDLIHIEKL